MVPYMLNKVKGAIIIPAFYKGSFLSVGRYLSLLELFKKDFMWDIIFTDDFTDESYDIIIILKSPNKGNINLMSSVKKLANNTKVILYLSDLHSNKETAIGQPTKAGLTRENTEFYTSILEMCDRADLILCPYKKAFTYKFPNHLDKFIFFPHFVDDEHIFPKAETQRNLMCLLSGATCPRVYPLRTKIEHYIYNKGPELFRRLQHPGYFKTPTDKDIVGQKYIDCLGSFFCAITSSSVFNYTIAKYYEIPAAGTLLIANDSGDLEELGFVDGKNYIKVNIDNVLDKTYDILYNVDNYCNVSKAGQELVLDNYTKSIAYKKLQDYCKEILM